MSTNPSAPVVTTSVHLNAAAFSANMSNGTAFVSVKDPEFAFSVLAHLIASDPATWRRLAAAANEAADALEAQA